MAADLRKSSWIRRKLWRRWTLTRQNKARVVPIRGTSPMSGTKPRNFDAQKVADGASIQRAPFKNASFNQERKRHAPKRRGGKRRRQDAGKTHPRSDRRARLAGKFKLRYYSPLTFV